MSLVLPENFSQAIRAGDYNLLRDYAFQIREYISTHKYLPEHYFNFLLTLLNDQDFLEIGGSRSFAITFDKEKLLTDSQRERLIPVKRFVYEDSYDTNPETIKEALNDAIRSVNSEKINDYCLTINTEFFGFGWFPEYWFDFFITLLGEKDFLNLQEGSSKLLNLFELNWSDLSDDQKERLLPILELNYRFFKDWMSFFNISSLLGECFCNKAAFEALRRLSEIPEEHPRSFIPHGFEHIVSDSKDSDLAKMAWVEIQRMKNDPAESVRDEVEISMQRLIRQNIKLANNES